ncbi:serine endoprotease [Stieleria neptunia]|uniref:Serine endoprotease n=1 Tax=Stieleria neptunia TaxID=2527979 RepID=A0A518HWI3_9BACT|nr:PDZ domain-containing protein [Stieleria neptunia]QDV45193.1 serine endoprotease [Stieleria neptunia]
MRSLPLLLSITTLVVSATCFADDARGQGLLQRLRSRIAPLIQDQLEPRDGEAANNALPARPLPGSGNQPAAGDPANEAAPDAAAGRTNPRARYRSLARPGAGGVSRIPAVTPPVAAAVSPTPAIGPSGVRQAGAETQPRSDAGSPATPRSNSFGRSILSPLDFDDETGPTSASAGTEASIGIKAIDADPGYPGVQITEFASHSRADRDGLRVGDFIFAIDGVPTPSVAALVDQVSARQPGDQVRLRIGRGGQVSDLDITLVAKPGTNPGPTIGATPPLTAQPPRVAQSPRAVNPVAVPTETVARPKIGAEVRDVPGRRGVRVLEIQPGSPADKAGLKVEDRIVAIDSKMVSDTQRLFDLLTLASTNAPVDLQLIRDNRLVNATLSLGSDDGPAVAGQATDATGSTPAPSESLVGGLGSVLGGMFGQTAPSSQTPSNTTDPKADQAKQAAEPELLPAAKEPQQESETQTAPSGESDSVQAEIQRLRDQLQQLESQLKE